MAHARFWKPVGTHSLLILSFLEKKKMVYKFLGALGLPFFIPGQQQERQYPGLPVNLLQN